MRVLDWYLCRHFWSSLWVCLAGLLGLYVVVDAFSQLERFLDVRAATFGQFLLTYYGVRAPFLALWLLPPSVLAAGMLTVTLLNRRNELVPIVGAGISLQRVLRPVFLSAALLAAAAVAAEEIFLPLFVRPILNTERILRGKSVESNVPVFDSLGNCFFIGAYDHVRREMRDVNINFFDSDRRRLAEIWAERGVWQADAQAWVLYQGKRTDYDRDHRRTGTRSFADEGYVLATDLSPDQLEKTERSVWYATVGDLFYWIRMFPDRPILQMRLQLKFTWPLSGMVLLLLGLPMVLRLQCRTFLLGVGICLLVGLLFYAAMLGSAELSKKDLVNAYLAAWLPMAGFGGLGLVLFRMVRT